MGLVQKPNVPWNQIKLTREEARERRLSDLNGFARYLGYKEKSVMRWVRNHESFPKPKAGIITPGKVTRAYSIDEVIGWYEMALKKGLVWLPAEKKV